MTGLKLTVNYAKQRKLKSMRNISDYDCFLALLMISNKKCY